MKTYLLTLLLMVSLFAGTYDDPYHIVKRADTKADLKLDQFMDGDFTEIKRFNRLDFSDGSLNEESKGYFKEIVKAIKKYLQEDKKIKIKIIGHARERTDFHNEKVVDSKVYANRIQNSFRFSQDENKTKKISRSFANEIAKKLQENKISKELLVVEYRGSNDLAFSTATLEGKKLSNRVMVTVYIFAPEDTDEDDDGVLKSQDKCPNTPANTKVDEKGCPLDLDKDGVFDSSDQCLDTPIGATVDRFGCAVDSDEDGVVDYKDNCPNTMANLNVDAEGCPITKELQLTFTRKSDVIAEQSYAKILKFVKFLKANPSVKAKIIGHTDSIGKQSDNMRLSFDRAYSVKAALIKEGIDEHRLEAVGRGELDPIVTNRTARGRAINRRIEVKLFN